MQVNAGTICTTFELTAPFKLSKAIRDEIAKTKVNHNPQDEAGPAGHSDSDRDPDTEPDPYTDLSEDDMPLTKRLK